MVTSSGASPCVSPSSQSIFVYDRVREERGGKGAGEEEEEEGLFKADAVNEKDPERDRACMNVCMDVCMPEEGEEEEPLRRKGDKTARPRQ